MRQNISMSASCMTRTTGRAVSGEMVLNSETLPCDLLCIDSWCDPSPLDSSLSGVREKGGDDV
jgi:hypothetical protein